ncbi:MAG: DUF3014 domain-containing protein [Halopseudomonas sp.]
MPQCSKLAVRGIALVQLLLVVVALLLLAGVGYLLLNDQPFEFSSPPLPPSSSPLQRTPVITESIAPALSSSAVASPAAVEPIAPTTESLRPEQVLNREPATLSATATEPEANLNSSDSPFRSALAQLDPTQQLLNWLVDEELIRKLVVTIDNMASGSIPRKHSLLLPMNDRFRASEKGPQTWLDGYNYSRYNTYVELLSAIDSRQWIELYRHYYPQMQQAYAELGYPRKAFHDRVLLALDHLLQSPVSSRALALAQPSVMYTFADPELEQLSAVHKQMLRLGPVNARRVLDAMTVLRAELVQLQHK